MRNDLIKIISTIGLSIALILNINSANASIFHYDINFQQQNIDLTYFGHGVRTWTGGFDLDDLGNISNLSASMSYAQSNLPSADSLIFDPLNQSLTYSQDLNGNNLLIVDLYSASTPKNHSWSHLELNSNLYYELYRIDSFNTVVISNGTFTITPVVLSAPIPSPIWLFISGLGFIALRRKNANKYL